MKDLEEKGSKLHSKQGIYTGMSLKELQQLNASPVYFYGWGLDNGGVLSSDNTGDIDFRNLIIKLSCDNCSLKYYSGEKFSSADAMADNQKIVVSSITIPG